jgi:hypothetical protein
LFTGCPEDLLTWKWNINGKSSASPKKMEESKTKDSDESEDDDAELRFLVALKLSPASTKFTHDNECVQDSSKTRLVDGSFRIHSDGKGLLVYWFE